MMLIEQKEYFNLVFLRSKDLQNHRGMFLLSWGNDFH